MARPRSIRFRYTLRALLVGVTLFCLAIGYVANIFLTEQKAKATLRSHGAQLSCRFGPFVDAADINAPLEPEVADALAALARLKRLQLGPLDAQHLSSNSRTKGSAPRAAPKGLLGRILVRQNLIALGIESFPLSEADYRAIGEHTSLESLSLDDTSPSEEAFARIMTLPRLATFSANSMPVTGRRLAARPGSTTLERVHCGYAPLGIEFARFLRRSPNVRELAIWDDNAVDDAFVAALRRHPRLADLDLFTPNSNLSDRSLDSLLELPRLTSVRLSGKYSTEALNELRQQRPYLNIR